MAIHGAIPQPADNNRPVVGGAAPDAAAHVVAQPALGPGADVELEEDLPEAGNGAQPRPQLPPNSDDVAEMQQNTEALATEPAKIGTWDKIKAVVNYVGHEMKEAARRPVLGLILFLPCAIGCLIAGDGGMRAWERFFFRRGEECNLRPPRQPQPKPENQPQPGAGQDLAMHHAGNAAAAAAVASAPPPPVAQLQHVPPSAQVPQPGEGPVPDAPPLQDEAEAGERSRPVVPPAHPHVGPAIVPPDPAAAALAADQLRADAARQAAKRDNSVEAQPKSELDQLKERLAVLKAKVQEGKASTKDAREIAQLNEAIDKLDK